MASKLIVSNVTLDRYLQCVEKDSDGLIVITYDNVADRLGSVIELCNKSIQTSTYFQCKETVNEFFATYMKDEAPFYLREVADTIVNNHLYSALVKPLIPNLLNAIGDRIKDPEISKNKKVRAIDDLIKLIDDTVPGVSVDDIELTDAWMVWPSRDRENIYVAVGAGKLLGGNLVEVSQFIDDKKQKSIFLPVDAGYSIDPSNRKSGIPIHQDIKTGKKFFDGCCDELHFDEDVLPEHKYASAMGLKDYYKKCSELFAVQVSILASERDYHCGMMFPQISKEISSGEVEVLCRKSNGEEETVSMFGKQQHIHGHHSHQYRAADIMSEVSTNTIMKAIKEVDSKLFKKLRPLHKADKPNNCGVTPFRQYINLVTIYDISKKHRASFFATVALLAAAKGEKFFVTKINPEQHNGEEFFIASNDENHDNIVDLAKQQHVHLRAATVTVDLIDMPENAPFPSIILRDWVAAKDFDSGANKIKQKISRWGNEHGGVLDVRSIIEDPTFGNVANFAKKVREEFDRDTSIER